MLKPGTFRGLIRNLRKANEMATKKKTTTTRTRTGTKTTARRNAGKKVETTTGMLNMRRAGPRAIAEAIVAREASLPQFGSDIVAWVEKLRAETSSTRHHRAAQVEPREATQH